MRKVLSVLSVGIFVLVLTGCEGNKTRVAEGAGIGGLLGAAAGGIIGHQSGHDAGGALIGAAVGAAAGGAVGSQIEKPAAKDAMASAPAVSVGQMSILEVIDLAKSKTPDDIIIDKIKKTGSKFNLKPEDVTYLQAQGVSQAVIDAMAQN
ncbi:MAG: glycine zipper domain-containing protein [Candidatus Omnitrophica bacterium]|jgi:hypothetical protein|nr:glycine zipper domain-containing protein [Candidatus Omnitrophota bacterium]